MLRTCAPRSINAKCARMPDSVAPAEDREFPPTAWTIVMTASDPTAPETLAAREELCRAYWQPVANYLRALGMSVPDSEDGAQEIITQLFGRDGLRLLNRERGRLRHYLKSAARHHVLNQIRESSAQKRGGGEDVLPLDEVPEAAHVVHEPESDSAFDREWALTLCGRAMKSLEASYERRNKAELLEALKPALILGDVVKPYAEISSLFAVTEAQIKTEVHRMRRRLADALRTEVAGTMSPEATAAEIDAETRYLVKTLAHEPRT